jgi:hypothetical protein
MTGGGAGAATSAAEHTPVNARSISDATAQIEATWRVGERLRAANAELSRRTQSRVTTLSSTPRVIVPTRGQIPAATHS